MNEMFSARRLAIGVLTLVVAMTLQAGWTPAMAETEPSSGSANSAAARQSVLAADASPSQKSKPDDPALSKEKPGKTALKVSTMVLPFGTVGEPYEGEVLTASGGKSPYSWTAFGLPEGLTVEGSTLTGTPSISGDFAVIVTVTDKTRKTASATFSLTVVDPLTIASTALPTVRTETEYPRTTLTALGGRAPYAWSAVGLPDGLALSEGGVLSGTATASGTFEVVITVTDSLQNQTRATFALLVDPPQDVEPPAVVEFDFAPKTVDVTGGPQTVTVTVRLTDATGLTAPYLFLDSDSTSQGDDGRFSWVSGTALDATYQRSVTIPVSAAPGTWTLQLGSITDTLGNTTNRVLHADKLTVVNTPQDVEPPAVVEFDFAPKTVDVTGGPQTVTVTVRLTDATGLTAPYLFLDSDSTSQGDNGPFSWVSGTALDATYQRSVTIPVTAAPGTWTLQLGSITDTLGNTTNRVLHAEKLIVINQWFE